jgi:hypothetical protein
MTTVRFFLVSWFGGSEMMWDVCLGVLIALFVVQIIKLIIAVCSHYL